MIQGRCLVLEFHQEQELKKMSCVLEVMLRRLSSPAVAVLPDRLAKPCRGLFLLTAQCLRHTRTG